MAGAAATIERQRAEVQPDYEVLEVRIPKAGAVPEDLRSFLDELPGYTERIEKAVAGEQLFWTEEDLAAMFECSVLTIKRERRAGKINFKRVAGKPIFTRRHIDEYLNR